jgi:hypothetical protein
MDAGAIAEEQNITRKNIKLTSLTVTKMIIHKMSLPG